MKMIRYILGVLLVSVSIHAEAQLSIYMDPHAFDSIANRSYQLNNSNAINTPTVDVTLTNQTGSAFADSIYFGYSVRAGGSTTDYQSYATVSSGIYYPTTYVTMPPQGSAVVGSLIFHFTSPVFVVGSSIVVIWPIVKGQTAQVDSATISFSITAPDGIGEEVAHGDKVYMHGSYLVIDDAENIIGDIRIYDITGQLILSREMRGDRRLPMQQYADGVYTVETITGQGTRKAYKVMKRSGY